MWFFIGIVIILFGLTLITQNMDLEEQDNKKRNIGRDTNYNKDLFGSGKRFKGSKFD